jgi:hypothetical protein
MMSTLRHLVTRSRLRTARETGQSLVEFAVVVTAFLLFIMGILDCARLFESWTAVQHASREGARFAITGRATCTVNGTVYSVSREDCIVKTVKNSTTGMLGGGPNGSSVSIECQSWNYSSGGYTARNDPTSNCGNDSSGNKSAGDQCDAVEVKVTYTHKFISPYLSALVPGGVPVVGRQRMINEPFGPCS